MLARILAAAATLCLATTPAAAASPTPASSASTLSASPLRGSAMTEPVTKPVTEPVVSGSAVTEPVVSAPMVVVGIAGLTWGNLTEDGAPTLWRMLGDGAGAAAMTVRTVHSPPCPLDGWLSLSAGRAATDPQPHRDRDCTALPAVTDNAVDGWAGLVTAQHASAYDPTLGLLGTTLADSNVCATAVGPGAALALADRQGRVARYYPTAQEARWDCPVTLVDAGVLDRRRDPGRALREADDTVREVLERAPSDATVVVLGVSQPLHSTLAMSALLVTGPGAHDQLLTAQSTRWPGIVRLLDIPSTIVGAVGVTEPNDFTGAALISAGHRPSAEDTARKLGDITQRDRDLRRSSGWFVNGLAAAVLLALAALAALRRTGRGVRGVEFGLLVLAALPLWSYLVRLIQWWRWPAPLVALWLGMLLGAVATALVLRRLPRTVTVLSGATVAVLALDAITGTVLHHGSPLGPSPLSGGRYYGFGNTTFVVFAVHAVIFAAGVARWLRSRTSTPVAAGAVAAIGLVTVAVDAWPTWGADVGGGFAIVPAFVLLTLDVLGRRIGVVRLLLTGAGAVAAVALISVLDWLRPATSRSHAGRFVEDLLHGDGLDVVTRKAGYAIGSLSAGPHLWLAGALLLYLIAVVVARRHVAPAWFERAVARQRYLWGCFVAVVTIAAIGSAANDYGLRIALLTFTVAGPPLALTITRTWDSEQRDQARG